ncbi:hypothetical protein [Chitinophaga japonensis]|uniref:Uncharacterized protein n=1 Tax=Chitinophaga japonensis TaxID=104662 RepID=A0A562T3X7_CHIJA|nr:hypothetical protein [Chitinophaga japonensis]TWI87944.1 hypothetical protein LX66_2018 [Chitinophaga japonensis]
MSKTRHFHILGILHARIHELPESFKDFVLSECQWQSYEYHYFIKHYHAHSRKDLKTILTIAEDLAQDLQALINRCKRSAGLSSVD